jgi:hypothetical protein
MYLENEDIHNIFWSAGIDSTYLVCKRLLIDKVPIQTYYLNFPCDGYHSPFPLGRDSREVEVKVMEKLREMIIKQFPYTENLFPRTILIDEFPINKEIYKKSKFLYDEYQYRYRLVDQILYMIQYSLHKNEIFEYGIDSNNKRIGRDKPVSKLINENLTENFTVSFDKIPELEILKNLYIPLFETWRVDMIRDSQKYGFTNILENTWSCRWPKSNGDTCGGVVDYSGDIINCCHYDYIDSTDEVIKYYKDGEFEILNRKNNYNDILND